jgi:O-methyltransferase
MTSAIRESSETMRIGLGDRRYLDLLKKSLSNELYLDMELRLSYIIACMSLKKQPVLEILVHPKMHLREIYQDFLEGRKLGRVRDFQAIIEGERVHVSHKYNYFYHTCIGEKRLDNLEYCVQVCTRDKIAGDVIETGVWRGGACVYLQALLIVYGGTDRRLWAADSFEGYPAPNVPQDAAIDHRPSLRPDQAIYQEEVEDLFRTYSVPLENVRFLKGWFKDTLPGAPIDRLAILRLDGNLYESTWDALSALYDKVSPGGFVIVDDYGALDACKQAVHDFIARRALKIELIPIDNDSVYWRA